MQLVNLVSAS